MLSSATDSVAVEVAFVPSVCSGRCGHPVCRFTLLPVASVGDAFVPCCAKVYAGVVTHVCRFMLSSVAAYGLAFVPCSVEEKVDVVTHV